METFGGRPKGIISGGPNFQDGCWARLVKRVCDLCGQPASRIHPTLCADCYYKYWERASQDVSRVILTAW